MGVPVNDRSTLSVVVFGSGSPLSVRALKALSSISAVAGVVVPPRGGNLIRRLASWRRTGSLRKACRQVGIPIVGASRDPGLERKLADLRPDMIVVASFPDIIPPALRSAASVGSFNIHFSLLPRHRGPVPLFWTYFHDDRETGVTIHWLTDRVDAGPIECQRSIPLDRGTPGSDLYARLVEISGELIAETVSRAMADELRRIEQNEDLATSKTRPDSAAWAIDFETWTAERVWHFLRGVGDREGRFRVRGLPLGSSVRYEAVDHGRGPGEIDWSRQGSRVYCRDGVVFTEALSNRAVIRRLFRALSA